MTKQHRQEQLSGLPACAMIQQVVKGRNAFFFWERVGEKGEVCVAGMCVCLYLTSWCLCDCSSALCCPGSYVGVNNLFQKRRLKDIWWENGFFLN